MCANYGPVVNYFSKPDRDRANRHTEQGMPRMHWVIGVKGNGDQEETFAQWTSGELQRLLKHLLDIVWKSFIRGDGIWEEAFVCELVLVYRLSEET